MSEHIRVGDDATKKMVKGVSTLAKIVGSTLGADGKHIFVEHPSAKIPISTKDGATVATWIELEDKFENIGAGMVKYAANKTAIDAGDGTTTTTIMADRLIQLGMEAAGGGMKVRNIVKGIEEGRDEAIKFLEGKKKAIEHDGKMVKKVAMVSSNYDEEISDMITEAIKKIGKNAVINVEKNLAGKTEIEYVEGVTLMSGFAHPVFVNTNHNECILKNVCIIMCDTEITKLEEIAHIFKLIEANAGIGKPMGITRKKGSAESHKPVESFLFIARDVQGEALSSLAKTKAEDNGPVAIAKAPFGDDFNILMRDLAIATGGTLIAENEGKSMVKMNPHTEAGWCEKIILGVDKLTIIGAEPDKDILAKRLDQLESAENKAAETQEKNLYRQRAARLSGKVAKLIVGGDNDAHIGERKDRADDAAQAVRSALEEGIVTGGGVSLVHAAEKLDHIPRGDSDAGQEVSRGIDIMHTALSMVFYQIAMNSGFDKEEHMAMRDKVVKGVKTNQGYNALTEQFEDLYKQGIIDPFKVLRCAIENSTKVATQLLNTGAAMYFLPNDDPRTGR